MPITQSEKGQRFQALHARPGAFLIPNPWDGGTARLLTHLGFEALTTTSSGLAFTLGKRDGTGEATREETLPHATPIAAAPARPVPATIQKGFSDPPDATAQPTPL